MGQRVALSRWRQNSYNNIIDGVSYAVGGHNGFEVQKSVAAYTPSTGVWTTISDMHFGRSAAGMTNRLIILNYYYMKHIHFKFNFLI